LDRTITEDDMDPVSARFVQGFRDESRDIETDLAVDGLSESLLVRVVRTLTLRRS
jgi:hypothetical protein